MNLDVIGVVLAIVVLTWLIWFVWTVVRGYPHSRGWQAARIAVALVPALVLVAWGTYWLMDSRTVQVMGDHVSRVDTTRKVAAAHPIALHALLAAGEEIGNHSYNHRRLVFVSTTTVRHEVDAADAVIRSAGYTGPITFRPPYAKKLFSHPFEMASAGRTTVMWDLEPDSQSDISSDPRAMTQYVVDGVQPGSIIELHPWRKGNEATRTALPLIMAALRQRGHEFDTVSELLALC